MKLVRTSIRNFRCYVAEVAVTFNDMTVLIGRNDAGKSTILDALDIFLNDGAPDRNDASKTGDPKDLAIICEFSDLPDHPIIDEDHRTTFQGEFLLNAEGNLEIHKVYNGSLATPKCSGVFAFAIHPTAHGVNDLLQLKNSELKKRAKEMNIDLTGVDQKVNAHLREAIRNSVVDLELRPVLVPLNEENAKKAWEGIRSYIPALALFKSDRISSDQDSEAQDPLKIAIREALKAREPELNAIFQHVDQEVRRIADKTLQKLREMDPTLAGQLNPQFSAPKWESLFKASITGDDDIPINKRGSGVRRLVLLNFFRAKAEQQANENSNASVIYAIEEPETSQHPNYQRLLVSALRELTPDNQVVLTTHTPTLAQLVPEESLRYVQVNEDKHRDILTGNEESNRLIKEALGILPDRSIKLFIGVEGPNDINFLKGISRILRSAGEQVLDLDKMETDGALIFFPLGGSTLALWTSRLEVLSRPEFHLYDRDNQPPELAKYQAQVDLINARDRCSALNTGKKEMENYLHFQAVNEHYAANNVNIALNASFGEFDSVPNLVARQVHEAGSATPWDNLNPETQKSKSSHVKRALNMGAISRMTVARLDEVDRNGDVRAWFAEMSRLAAL